jgi:hypothetical protein
VTAMTCPHCGKNTNNHQHVGEPHDIQPTDGDVSLCWHCGEPSVFALTEGGSVTACVPSTAESADIEADPRVQAARRARAAHPESVYAATNAARQAVKAVSK